MAEREKREGERESESGNLANSKRDQRILDLFRAGAGSIPQCSLSSPFISSLSLTLATVLPSLPTHHAQPIPSLRVDEREARRIAATLRATFLPYGRFISVSSTDIAWRRLGASLG